MMFLFESKAAHPHRLALLASGAPHAKLLAAFLLALACLIAPATSPGFLLIVFVTGLHIVASGISRTQIRPLARMYLLGYIPFVAVILLARQFLPEISEGGNRTDVTAFVWSVLLRGAATMGIAASSVAAMTTSEFEEGLHRLIHVQLLTLLIMQILQQTGVLLAETRRASDAIALRSSSGGRYGMLLLARNIPNVWLPRMLYKAERVASAMEVRQFGDTPVVQAHGNLSWKEWLFLIFSVLVLATSVALHTYRIN